MAAFEFANHFASGHVQGGKKRCRTITSIVVRVCFRQTVIHRQGWLGPVQCLNLALLVHAQNQGFIRGIKIEPNNIPDFFNEMRVSR